MHICQQFSLARTLTASDDSAFCIVGFSNWADIRARRWSVSLKNANVRVRSCIYISVIAWGNTGSFQRCRCTVGVSLVSVRVCASVSAWAICPERIAPRATLSSLVYAPSLCADATRPFPPQSQTYLSVRPDLGRTNSQDEGTSNRAPHVTIFTGPGV